MFRKLRIFSLRSHPSGCSRQRLSSSFLLDLRCSFSIIFYLFLVQYFKYNNVICRCLKFDAVLFQRFWVDELPFDHRPARIWRNIFPYHLVFVGLGVSIIRGQTIGGVSAGLAGTVFCGGWRL